MSKVISWLSMRIFVKWFINALALFIVSRVVPGITLSDFKAALIAVIIISLVNVFVKPLLLLLTLPVNLLTLGLFTFVINALMLMLAAYVTPGFEVSGLGSALVGSLLLSVISVILQKLVA